MNSKILGLLLLVSHMAVAGGLDHLPTLQKALKERVKDARDQRGDFLAFEYKTHFWFEGDFSKCQQLSTSDAIDDIAWYDQNASQKVRSELASVVPATGLKRCVETIGEYYAIRSIISYFGKNPLGFRLQIEHVIDE